MEPVPAVRRLRAPHAARLQLPDDLRIGASQPEPVPPLHPQERPLRALHRVAALRAGAELAETRLRQLHVPEPVQEVHERAHHQGGAGEEPSVAERHREAVQRAPGTPRAPEAEGHRRRRHRGRGEETPTQREGW